jgi:hypothetical protein
LLNLTPQYEKYLTPQTLAAGAVFAPFVFSKKCDSFSRPRDLPC